MKIGSVVRKLAIAPDDVLIYELPQNCPYLLNDYSTLLDYKN